MTELTSLSVINDSLLLSGYGPVIKQNLKKYGITVIVDATKGNKRQIEGYEYVKVDVDDSEWAKLSPFFDPVADKIHQVKGQGGKALVHCAAGVSRSCALVLAYLMKYENMTLRDAYYLVKERRSIVAPNNGFWRQLIEYEVKLRGGESSVKMERGLRREAPDVYFAHLRN